MISNIFAKTINLSRNFLMFFFVLLVFLVPGKDSFALPALFQDELVLSGFNRPVSMTSLPDGRMLVIQKGGQIYILDPNLASPGDALTPYMTITDINQGGERGLLNIVLDPDFPSQPYIYVVYHRDSDQRMYLSRFTHQGNTANINSEFVIWKDPNTFVHPFHHGGGLSFGPDKHLYLTTGEQFNGLRAQDLNNAGGKILRIARDGSIPSDNPYVGQSGILPEVWAHGLRNPWRAKWDIPTSGSIGPRLFIGDVGGNLGSSNEDIHLGKKGVNYGWPYCAGNDCNNSNEDYDPPIFTHEHAGRGASIMGGFVYHGGQYPASYSGVYFFGDYNREGGIISYLAFNNNGDVIGGENRFLDRGGLIVDLKEGKDGALYYIQIASNESFIANTGALRRIIYNDGNQAPQITSAVADVTQGESPLTVQFSGSATDAENDNLDYLWLFGDGDIAAGANVSHTYTTNGSHSARLQVSETTGGKTTTLNPPITIIVGTKPEVTINEPVFGSTFRAGQAIDYSAVATDDGPLTENSYNWTVLYVHNDHTHPELGPVTGSSGTLHTPNTGHSFFDDTGFEISVEVTDQEGLSETDIVRIFPEKVDISFNSQPSGISFFLDDTIVTTPIVYDTAIDFIHTITAPQTTCLNGSQKFSFVNWSNGEAASQIYVVPDNNETMTAIYIADGTCNSNSNLSPLAFADEFSMISNVSRIINVLDNDVDSDGSIAENTISIVSHPQHGQVSVNSSTGTVSYSHDGSEATSDFFTYTVEDQLGAVSNEATVLISITSSIANCGQGIELDGFNDWVNIPDLTLANDFTIESWVKLAPGIDNNDALFGQEGGGADVNFYAGKARLFVSGDKVTANTAILPDTWTHIAITRSGSNLALYINGVLDATGSWAGSLSLKAIGRGNRGFLKGMVDEVRIWNVARTGSEIDQSYDTSVDLNTTGLISYWSLNGLGQTLIDASSSENHASLGVNTAAGTDDPVRLDSTALPFEDCNGGGSGGGNTNVAPLAVNDNAGSVIAGGSISFSVTGNDTDSDGNLDPESVVIVSAPNYGNATVNSAGTISYTADSRLTAIIDTLSYKVADTEGAFSNIATVSISVTVESVSSCGKGIQLDGINDWVNMPDLTLANDFTLEAWVKLAPGIDNKDALFGQEGAGPDINFYAGKVRLYSYGDRVKANTAVLSDIWTHIAITRSGNNLTLYINGVQDAVGFWNGTFNVNAIGRGNKGFLKGMIDEVRVWNVARTETEIDQSYDTSVDPNTTGLISYWSLNGSGQTITDATSLGNHASLGVNTAAGTDDPVRLDSTALPFEDCNGGGSGGGNTNVAPLAVNDNAGSVIAGGSISFSVTGNDTDSDGNLDPESVVIVSAPNYGNATVNSAGTISYTADSRLTAITDTLSYKVADTEGAFSNIATVSISVTVESVSSCGKGIQLDGINDWVNMPDLTLANDFTLEAWIKLAPGIDNKDALFGQEGAGTDLNFYASKARLYAAGRDRVTATTAMSPDTWTHIAITRSGNNLTLYINGVQDAVGFWNGTFNVKAIGRGNAGFLKGIVDEVRIWNVARTGAEIDQSYDTSVDPNTTGLISYWSLNGAGQTITDATSLGNHASLGVNTATGTDDPVRLDSTALPFEDCNGGGSGGGNTNVAPLAVNDNAGSVIAGGSISFSVTGNDTDNDGNLDPESVVIVSAPSYGNATVNSAGTISYTAVSRLTAITDTLSYKVADTEGAFSNIATVSISVTVESVSSCGKGIQLDGINDWVNMPDLTLANDFTLEAWVKLAPGIDNKDALFGQEGAGPDVNFYAGKVRLYSYGDRVKANTAVLSDTWTHIAITRSGNNLTLYINGVQDAVGFWNGTFNVKAIGRGNKGFLKGMIDEVRIWDVARTGTEIGASFNTTVVTNVTGLIGYWNFNGTGQTVSDLSGSANHSSLGSTLGTGTDDPERKTSTADVIESCN